ncbi:hypothetical protein BGZ94_000702 [Podila epigama]|nr:hypothetical protein BGZ94_000702 [Podila epigama]
MTTYCSIDNHGKHGTLHCENVTTDLPSESCSLLGSQVSSDVASAQATTWKQRIVNLCSSEVLTTLALGQLLSLCITATTIFATKLAQGEKPVSIPTTQSFLNYFVLGVTYTFVSIYKEGPKEWVNMMRRRGPYYLLFAFVDVEGNYFVVKAYSYTSLLSVMLLDAWTIPCVVLLSVLFLKMRFLRYHYLGVVMAIVGMGFLIWGDMESGKNYPGSDYIKGDLFCLLGATLYAVSNVYQEFLVRQAPMYEVVGQLGFWGTIVNGIQLVVLERDEHKTVEWTPAVLCYIIGFDIALFILYSVSPILFRRSSATFFNLNLLTSDFYGLIFGILLFGAKASSPAALQWSTYIINGLYPIAFVLIIAGIIVYNIYPAPVPHFKPSLCRDRETSSSSIAHTQTDESKVTCTIVYEHFLKMASILFDDITFPTELYDPDTFEFVAPVSTLLSFTPHILSQLAKDSEKDQEPFLPTPPNNNNNNNNNNSDKPNNNERNAHSDSTSSLPRNNASTESGGFFSTLKSVASDQAGRKLLENGIYLATQLLESSSSRSQEHNNSQSWNRHQDSTFESSSSSNWFKSTRSQSYHESQHLQALERRLRQMEQEIAQSSLLSRSEIESQRRERHKLEQELEAQRVKVRRLEKELADRQKKEELNNLQGKDEKGKESTASLKSQYKQNRRDEHTVVKTEADDDDDEAREEETTGTHDKSSEKKTLLKKSGHDKENTDDTMSPVVLAAVGAASLAVTLFSAHKASSLYSVITFHDQLEMLLAQCSGVIQSTEVWISEQFLEVPDQVRLDIKMIKELIETIERLDPRSEKKAETIAWSMSAVGSLGTVGGAVLGSITAMAGGGVLVLGCTLYGIIARARYNGPEYKGARTMMEMRTIQILKSLGVNPSAPTLSGGSTQTARSRAFDERINRLRMGFEKREGYDMKDADEIEIDGLLVEEGSKEEILSTPQLYSGSPSTLSSNRLKAARSNGSHLATPLQAQQEKGQRITERAETSVLTGLRQ